MDKSMQLIEDCIKMINETIAERYADISKTQILSECKKLSKNIRFLNSVNTSLEALRFGRGGDLAGSLPERKRNIQVVMDYITDREGVTMTQLMQKFLLHMSGSELDGILSTLKTTEFIKVHMTNREIFITQNFNHIKQKEG